MVVSWLPCFRDSTRSRACGLPRLHWETTIFLLAWEHLRNTLERTQECQSWRGSEDLASEWVTSVTQLELDGWTDEWMNEKTLEITDRRTDRWNKSKGCREVRKLIFMSNTQLYSMDETGWNLCDLINSKAPEWAKGHFFFFLSPKDQVELTHPAIHTHASLIFRI